MLAWKGILNIELTPNIQMVASVMYNCILRPSQETSNGSPVAHSQSAAGHVLQNANATPRLFNVIAPWHKCPIMSDPLAQFQNTWWVLVMSADWSEMNLRRAKMLVPWSVFCFLVVKGKHLPPFSCSTWFDLPSCHHLPTHSQGARIPLVPEFSHLPKRRRTIDCFAAPQKSTSRAFQRNKCQPWLSLAFGAENMHVVDALDNSILK